MGPQTFMNCGLQILMGLQTFMNHSLQMLLGSQTCELWAKNIATFHELWAANVIGYTNLLIVGRKY